jgi:membrane protein required for colicin V production
MSFLDIILGCALVYGLYKGILNGLFVEIASLISLILGIYIAIQFSIITADIISSLVNWNPKTIQAVAFLLTFVLVVVGIALAAKFLTKIASFAYLGWINKAGGGGIRLLKTVLILGVFLNLFEKINFNHFFAKKETLDHSLFYRPIQKTADFVFPAIQKQYNDLRKK